MWLHFFMLVFINDFQFPSNFMKNIYFSAIVLSYKIILQFYILINNKNKYF